jgi:hypothetical protein
VYGDLCRTVPAKDLEGPEVAERDSFKRCCLEGGGEPEGGMRGDGIRGRESI